MTPNRLLSRCLVVALLAAAPGVATACGEGMFSAGNGLAYQGYLAPRPATVLVYAAALPGADDATQRERLLAGLQRAGHTVIVVDTEAGLSSAFATRRFDVVLTGLHAVDEVVTASMGARSVPQLVPVVPRAERRSPAVRERFANFVVDAAGIGQYLGAINGAMKIAAN